LSGRHSGVAAWSGGVEYHAAIYAVPDIGNAAAGMAGDSISERLTADDPCEPSWAGNDRGRKDPDAGQHQIPVGKIAIGPLYEEAPACRSNIGRIEHRFLALAIERADRGLR
jgi:hypothetical protein